MKFITSLRQIRSRSTSHYCHILVDCFLTNKINKFMNTELSIFRMTCLIINRACVHSNYDCYTCALVSKYYYCFTNMLFSYHLIKLFMDLFYLYIMILILKKFLDSSKTVFSSRSSYKFIICILLIGYITIQLNFGFLKSFSPKFKYFVLME